MTAAVESLTKAYPDRYRISVDTSCPAIWENNPHVHEWEGGREIVLEYPAINASHQLGTGHFMGAFCSNLADHLGHPVPLLVNRPALYLTDQEKEHRRIEEPYLIVNAGSKSDFTRKQAPTLHYQAVVDHFRGRLAFVQIGQAHHQHKPLDGVIDLIGQTNDRELYSLIYNGLGGIGPTIYAQHIHAALGKFYICIAGGGEPKHWLDYPTQTTLSTMGQLPCCRLAACWKSRTVPLNDGDDKDRSLCVLPVECGGQWVPKCMEAASNPDTVIHAIETYLNALES